MNAVEIEDAVSNLFEAPYDAETFPFEFLRALGNKDTTIKRLKSGNTNRSDVGGVLQRNHIHLLLSEPGELEESIRVLRASPQTAKAKARFLFATDGNVVHAQDLQSGDDLLVCAFKDLPDHFAYFLPLAGIETVAEIRDNAVDIRATGRLNRLYVALIQENPEWGTVERSEDMNHFMARLIFAFFAEDTEIFGGVSAFTTTLERMTERDGSNVHTVLETLFRSMNTPHKEREAVGLPRWATDFPLVNGNLFAGAPTVPTFSRITRGYLLHLGHLDWTKINPDIFGSMIQAVAEPEERAELGMHYTSVPNILKVLNPLFLDDLRKKLEEAGDNTRKLLNLRKRIARIRVFDPACGSGNFLVIAYKQLRDIEYKINVLRDEADRRSDIALTNFRGIELRHFAAEIARLALIIAQYQCDAQYLGQNQALKEFLPLSNENWIVRGNALQLDWKTICPPVGTSVSIIDTAPDLFDTPLEQPAMNFDNEGGETYICGNPPFLGSTYQSKEQKADLTHVFEGKVKSFRSLDYVTAWFMKAAEYREADVAFVSTNSICQGQQVARFWPAIFAEGMQIHFAVTSFKWANLASYNAGVTVIVVGLLKSPPVQRVLYDVNTDGSLTAKIADNINAYLVAGPNLEVVPRRESLVTIALMDYGNKPTDGGNLLLSYDEYVELTANLSPEIKTALIRRIYGSREFIRGEERYCLWISDENLPLAMSVPAIRERIEAVRAMRLASSKKATQVLAEAAHRFAEIRQTGDERVTIIPRVSSENREYLPVGLKPEGTIVTDLVFALYDAPLWNLALIASRIHLVWIGTVCGKMKTDFRYSNTLGWNTFPVPTLTQKNKDDLTRCAEDILLAREAHYPATIADLYDGDAMPENLREAHLRNDEVVERIFIGRRFRNDTERLETLFQRYAERIEAEQQGKGA